MGVPVEVAVTASGLGATEAVLALGILRARGMLSIAHVDAPLPAP